MNDKIYLFPAICCTVLLLTACTQQKITDPSEITFRISGDSVEVMQREKVLQTLSCDYTPDDEKMIAEDYDFDGYADLFVMMEDGAMYAPEHISTSVRIQGCMKHGTNSMPSAGR